MLPLPRRCGELERLRVRSRTHRARARPTTTICAHSRSTTRAAERSFTGGALTLLLGVARHISRAHSCTRNCALPLITGSAHDHAQYVDCVCRYFPDSYDEWLPLSEIQGEPEPNPAPPPQWHVFARYAPLCPPQQRP